MQNLKEGEFRLKRLDPWILAALVVALIVRFINLDEAALWFDETLTADRIRLTWVGALQDEFFSGKNANQVPLYFLLVKAWSTIAGFSPTALRLPSVILSLVTLVLIAGIAKTLCGEKAARWAAWLAAVSPYLLHHAQEARMYPLMSALSAASILLLARYLRGASPRLGIGFVLVNLALLATHYYAMFLVSAVILVPLVLHPRPLKAWLPALSATGTGLLGLVLAALLIAGHQSGELYQIGLLAFPGVVWSMLSGYTLLPSSEELHALGIRAALPYLALAATSAIPLGIGLLAGIKSLDRDARLLILSILAVPLLAPFLVQVIFPEVSINPRYAMPAIPAFVVLLSAGISQGFRQHGAVTLSAVVLVGIMTSGSVRHLLSPGHGRADIYAADSWLDVHVPIDEEILVTSEEMYHLASFHWPNRRLRLYPARKVVANRENAAEIAKEVPFTQGNRLIYIFGRAWLSDPDGALQDALLGRYTTCPETKVRGIRILCLESDANR
jgi:4-amino-4-deoxy-L-arabinose transferase-like glycosyltransferase